MVAVFLSLGSNLGDRLGFLMRAVRLLRDVGTVTGTSRLYATDPILYSRQPDFLNCAMRLDTTLSPEDLLSAVKVIEQTLGRTFTVEKGPREIDIDISLYGDCTVNTPTLTIPHPGVTQRDFVIRTLLDIDPTLAVNGRPLEDYLPTAFVSHPRLAFPTNRQTLELGKRTLLFAVVDSPAAAELTERADVFDLTSVQLLKELRGNTRFAKTLLCVRVSTPQEAEEAIAAGADIIRDEAAGACAAVCEEVPYIYVRPPSEAVKSPASLTTTEHISFNCMLDPAIGLLPSANENWQALRALKQLQANCSVPLLVSVPEAFLRSQGDAETSFLAIVGAAAEAKVDCISTGYLQRTQLYLQVADTIYRS